MLGGATLAATKHESFRNNKIDRCTNATAGLVNKVYPQAELLNKTLELAEKIASKGQQAIRFALKAVKATDNMSSSEGLSYEASLFALTCGTEDFKEGTSAFLQKRKPDYKNR